MQILSLTKLELTDNGQRFRAFNFPIFYSTMPNKLLILLTLVLLILNPVRNFEFCFVLQFFLQSPAQAQKAPEAITIDGIVYLKAGADVAISPNTQVGHRLRKCCLCVFLRFDCCTQPVAVRILSAIPDTPCTSNSNQESDWIDPTSEECWINASICFVLVCLFLPLFLSVLCAQVMLSGLFSGLTVGLMSVSTLQMSVLRANDSGDPRERQYAERLEPVLRPDRHHRLLVTLLLANAAAMEALPIFLNKLGPEWFAIMLSVGFVLVFGEIIPQAACMNRCAFNLCLSVNRLIIVCSPLKIGSFLVPVVKFFMAILCPVAWPIGKLLDRILGHRGAHFLSGRSELQSLLTVTQRERVLDHNETRILQAVMKLKSKTVRHKQTLEKDICMLSEDDVLDRNKLQQILDSGHSRIPVYRGTRNNICNLLLVKSLIVVNPEDRLKVSQLPSRYMRPPLFVSPETELLPLLEEFLSQHMHLAFVTEQAAEVGCVFAIAACNTL